VLLSLAGGLILWIGWGQAWDLIKPVKVACGIQELRGLHVDSLGRVIYANSQCPMIVYDNAWLVFGTLSIVGIGFIGGGMYLLKKQ
jgi:hypothetical protein